MMTKEEFITLRDFVYEKSGIFFAENKAYLLESRLTNRLDELGLSSFEDYYYCLKYGSDKAKNEITNLFDVVTTNETSFFRNPPQLEAFKILIQKNYLNGTCVDCRPYQDMERCLLDRGGTVYAGYYPGRAYADNETEYPLYDLRNGH